MSKHSLIFDEFLLDHRKAPDQILESRASFANICLVKNKTIKCITSGDGKFVYEMPQKQRVKKVFVTLNEACFVFAGNSYDCVNRVGSPDYVDNREIALERFKNNLQLPARGTVYWIDGTYPHPDWGQYNFCHLNRSKEMRCYSREPVSLQAKSWQPFETFPVNPLILSEAQSEGQLEKQNALTFLWDVPYDQWVTDFQLAVYNPKYGEWISPVHDQRYVFDKTQSVNGKPTYTINFEKLLDYIPPVGIRESQLYITNMRISQSHYDKTVRNVFSISVEDICEEEDVVISQKLKDQLSCSSFY